jgi:hypothetical protein
MHDDEGNNRVYCEPVFGEMQLFAVQSLRDGKTRAEKAARVMFF